MLFEGIILFCINNRIETIVIMLIVSLFEQVVNTYGLVDESIYICDLIFFTFRANAAQLLCKHFLQRKIYKIISETVTVRAQPVYRFADITGRY